MIVIALKTNGDAEMVAPARVYQGSDGNDIVVLSPYPKNCPLKIAATFPNETNSGYSAMEAITLPDTFVNRGVSAWRYRPARSWTSLFGTMYINVCVQSEAQSFPEYDENDNLINGDPVFLQTTSYMCPIQISESTVPNLPADDPYIPETDVDALLTEYNNLIQIMASYAAQIESVQDVIDAADNSPINMSQHLVKSGGTYTAIQNAKGQAIASANEYTDEKIRGITGDDIVTGISFDAGHSYEHGNIILTKGSIGLGNVDNTADADKPVSTAQRQAINAAEQAAKDYAGTLSFEGQGTKVYENGVNSATIDIPKVYLDVRDVDASFDRNTTPETLLAAMEVNSILESPSVDYRGYNLNEDPILPTYRKLIPYGAGGVNGILHFEKRRSHFSGIYCVRASYSSRKTVNWEGTGNKFDVRNKAVVFYDSIYVCPNTITSQDTPNIVYKSTDWDQTPITLSDDGTYWIYAFYFIDYNGGGDYILFVGLNNGKLCLCKYKDGIVWSVSDTTTYSSNEFQFCADETGGYIYLAVPRSSVFDVYKYSMHDGTRTDWSSSNEGMCGGIAFCSKGVIASNNLGMIFRIPLDGSSASLLYNTGRGTEPYLYKASITMDGSNYIIAVNYIDGSGMYELMGTLGHSNTFFEYEKHSQASGVYVDVLGDYYTSTRSGECDIWNERLSNEIRFDADSFTGNIVYKPKPTMLLRGNSSKIYWNMTDYIDENPIVEKWEGGIDQFGTFVWTKCVSDVELNNAFSKINEAISALES